MLQTSLVVHHHVAVIADILVDLRFQNAVDIAVAALALRSAHDEHVVVVLLDEGGIEFHLGIVGLGHVGRDLAGLFGVRHLFADIAEGRLDLDAQDLVEVGVGVGVHHEDGALFLLAQIVDDHAAGRRLADAALSGNCNDMGMGHKKRSLERSAGRRATGPPAAEILIKRDRSGRLPWRCRQRPRTC